MSTRLKRMLHAGILTACIAAMGCTSTLVYAEPSTKDLEDAASGLQGELNNLNTELTTLTADVANLSQQIKSITDEMNATQEKLNEAQKKGQEQYESMKLRIKYMYEAGEVSFLELLCSAENMTDFLNKTDFVKNISEYDRSMLLELLDTQNSIKKAGDKLKEQQNSLLAMEQSLDTKRATLESNITASTAQLAQYNDQIAKAKAEEELARARAAEAAAKAERERQLQLQQNVIISGGSQTTVSTPGSSEGKTSIGSFKITHYCSCYYCSGGWGSSTSSGATPIPGRTIAVDPSVIPMGSRVIINGNIYVAEDVGGAIKGNKIDIYVSDHATALAYGVYYAEVYWAD